MSIYVITGNINKIRELKEVFPGHVNFEITKLDLDEIQSLDTTEIVHHKLRQAYELLKKPVIVEDVSAELDNLNGLPGPFIKFFEHKLGPDALYKLSYDGAKAKIICTMGYYDGENEHIVEGVVGCTIVPPRGKKGFGFDIVVMPNGYDQTFAEMDSAKKNSISHRHIASKKLADLLQNI